MLNIKRVYDPPSSDDGERILVDRLWPRGVSKEKAVIDEWIKDIAPSDKLRKWFSHDTDKWTAFRDRYVKELGTKTEIVKKLRSEAKKKKITLLFAAKDTEHNNAVVLKEVIQNKK